MVGYKISCPYHLYIYRPVDVSYTTVIISYNPNVAEFITVHMNLTVNITPRIRFHFSLQKCLHLTLSSLAKFYCRVT